jgi:hypothetical protein
MPPTVGQVLEPPDLQDEEVQNINKKDLIFLGLSLGGPLSLRNLLAKEY